MTQHDSCPETRLRTATPCKTVFAPFIAVFDRLFAEHESKAVGESITWQFRHFFHRLKTAKTVKTAPHEIGGEGCSDYPHFPLVRYPLSEARKSRTAA